MKLPSENEFEPPRRAIPALLTSRFRGHVTGLIFVVPDETVRERVEDELHARLKVAEDGAEYSPAGNRSDTPIGSRLAHSPERMTTVEVPETASLVLVLVLSESERRALLRLLYVVKDNFWLDDIEETLLERLLEPAHRMVANERSGGVTPTS
jgi:hypothetical protein